MKVFCWHCSKPFIFEGADGKKESFVKCPHCGKGFEDLSKEAQKAVLNTFRQFAWTKKEVVIWKQNDTIIIWDAVQRTPALGWNTLTLLEALCDSAKTSLAIGNLDRTEKQLNKMLKILRKKISLEKKRNPQSLLQRCEYRETKRTRCNKTPVFEYNGKYYCKYHLTKVKNL